MSDEDNSGLGYSDGIGGFAAVAEGATGLAGASDFPNGIVGEPDWGRASSFFGGLGYIGDVAAIAENPTENQVAATLTGIGVGTIVGGVVGVFSGPMAPMTGPLAGLIAGELAWRAPMGWSGLIVSALSASGPLERCFPAQADDIPKHCAA